MNEILPNLFLGDKYDAQIFDGEIICVLEKLPDYEPKNAVLFPIFKNSIVDRKELDLAIEAIDFALKKGKKVLVHCVGGAERSPLTVVWYLHSKKGMTIEEAYNLVMEKRPLVQRRDSWLSYD
jgi:protein-tyrosine phosphatase